MSLDAFLIHTCTIENPAITDATVNAYRNKVEAFDAPLENVRCRLVESRERVWSTERQESTIQSVYKLFVSGSATLSERGQISKVTLEDGTIVKDTFVVTEVMTRRSRSSHHKMATLERIS